VWKICIRASIAAGSTQVIQETAGALAAPTGARLMRPFSWGGRWERGSTAATNDRRGAERRREAGFRQLVPPAVPPCLFAIFCLVLCFVGAGNENRTRDLLITSQPLYQLSYPGFGINREMRTLRIVGQPARPLFPIRADDQFILSGLPPAGYKPRLRHVREIPFFISGTGAGIRPVEARRDGTENRKKRPCALLISIDFLTFPL
jgi:hypothetical protein